jgi:hypothetical protein
MPGAMERNTEKPASSGERKRSSTKRTSASCHIEPAVRERSEQTASRGNSGTAKTAPYETWFNRVIVACARVAGLCRALRLGMVSAAQC